ncbi:hypothetical protein S40285_05476 [Stachybotrys chlorohalonatus IBT 40285]|uniref:Thioredoxin n=1 Tax=Stachybotrys chlorohalonatus (strain IBT 40285) TaxID=1283841 RepID=A0A084QYM7_STAC4|nr:hypothetical protein S40285_05476 [Stachybotrys chlorohalonata IBT 40285]
MTVHNIQSFQDYKDTLSAHPNVLIDFYATWCGPCKVIAPLLVQCGPYPSTSTHSNEDKFKDIYFAKVDIEEVPDLATELGIRAMPTLVLFKNGEKLEETVGPNPTTLPSFIQKAL